MWQHYDGQDVGSHVGPSHRHWTMEMAVLPVPFSRCDSRETVAVRRKRPFYMYSEYASKSSFPAGSALTAKQLKISLEELLAVPQWWCRRSRKI